MIIGTIKEKKKFENRVAISPDEAKSYIKLGHQVQIEKNAGSGVVPYLPLPELSKKKATN